MDENKTQLERVSSKFFEEISDVKSKIVPIGKNKKKVSLANITEMITKHKEWKKIKGDIINYFNETQ